ncbi:MAG: hypothetical protein HY294_09885 [Candidatus Rokubacteria bacterium]|nr:hypothetical protein [Candidatus Rokubacteria bacterium]MBI3826294.1 hypothetical protein [Candidatus Rokubacteria bacterium]
MIETLAAMLITGTLVLAPLAWRAWRDRAEEHALAVRADVHNAVVRALHGESLVAVDVEPATPWHGERVVLSTPSGWATLLEQVWPRVIERVPPGAELVVRPFGPTEAELIAQSGVVRPAA